jgi:hypothetical protein
MSMKRDKIKYGVHVHDVNNSPLHTLRLRIIESQNNVKYHLTLTAIFIDLFPILYTIINNNLNGDNTNIYTV